MIIFSIFQSLSCDALLLCCTFSMHVILSSLFMHYIFLYIDAFFSPLPIRYQSFMGCVYSFINFCFFLCLWCIFISLKLLNFILLKFMIDLLLLFSLYIDLSLCVDMQDDRKSSFLFLAKWKNNILILVMFFPHPIYLIYYSLLRIFSVVSALL